MAPEGDAEIVQGLLLRIVVALVEREEDVRVKVRSSDQGTNFSVCVDCHDMGKLIGKSGRMAKAVRMLLTEIGMKHSRRYLLFIEPAASEPLLTGSPHEA